MKSIIHFTLSLLGVLFLCISIASAQSTRQFRSYQSGNWNDVNTWEMFDNLGQYHYPALYTPTTEDSINILTGHNVTITANVTVDSVLVAPGATLNVDAGVTVSVAPSGNTYGIGLLGNMVVNGTLMNAGVVVTDSLGTLTVNGVLSNAGIVWAQNGVGIRVAAGGIYEHAQDGGWIPGAIWDSLSTCKITGYVAGSKPGNGNQNFYNYEWDCPGQSATKNIDLGWHYNTGSSPKRVGKKSRF
jgi:hypothetical protein